MSKDTWAYYGPFESFPFPVAPPTALPFDQPHRSLCINHDWVPYLVGALKVLLQPETWDASDATIQAIRGQLYELINQWESTCVSDIQFRSPTACTLEFSSDGGATWTQIYDAQACIDANIANGTIPGSGALPPAIPVPSTCVDYFPAISAASSYTLPDLVSTGDTIEVTVHATPAAWTDDIFAFTLYCPDGTFFDLVTSICGSGDPAHSGDPLMTANHMELIAKIGSTYFRPMLGKFTIPAGITRQPIQFFANDVLIGDNVGTIVFKIEYCSIGWKHEFDFTASDGGWIGRVPYSAYDAGQGWRDASNALYVRAPFRTANYTLIGIIAEFTVSTPDTATGNVGTGNVDASFAYEFTFSSDPSLFQTGGATQWFGVHAIDTTHAPEFAWAKDTASTAVVHLTKVTLYGLGTDPY